MASFTLSKVAFIVCPRAPTLPQRLNNMYLSPIFSYSWRLETEKNQVVRESAAGSKTR